MSEPLIVISTFRVKEGKLEYYGVPPKSALDLDDIDVQSEQDLTLKPLHIAGFTRSPAGRTRRQP